MSTRASRRNRASRSACRTAAGPYRFESGNVTTGTFASRYRAKSGPLSSSVNTIGSKRVRSSRSMVRAAFNSVPPTRMVETQWATRIGRLPSARAGMGVAAIRCSLFSAAPNVVSGALARIATSPASLSEDDDRKCQEHDPHVLDQRLAAQALQAVSPLYASVVPRRVVGVIDLCQACDPRLRPLPEGALRQRAKPGITGLAQINHSYDASGDDARVKGRYGLECLRRQSLIEDMRIMLLTLPVIVFRKGGW